MKPPLLLLAFAAFLALMGCARPDPTKINFSDNSSNAVVLLKVEPARLDYDLNFMAFDEENQSLEIHLFTNAIRFHIKDPNQPAYVALVAKPGTYVFQDVVQQQIWGLCFNNQTRAFTLHPNEVVFLGDFRPQIHLEQLHKLAVDHNELTGVPGTSMNDFFDKEILPPQITTPTETSSDFLAAKQYEASSLPWSKGRLKPIEYRPAKFGVGYVWTGQRVCGGLMKEDVKKGS